MSALMEIGIRKTTELGKVSNWTAIYASRIPGSEMDGLKKFKSGGRSYLSNMLSFTENPPWKFIILLTVFFNTVIIINIFFVKQSRRIFFFIAEGTSIPYAIDLLVEVIKKIHNRKRRYSPKTRKVALLIIDFIAVFPSAIIYYGITNDVNSTVIHGLRVIELLRFYRIPLYAYEIRSADKKHKRLVVALYVLYLIIFINIISSLWMWLTHETMTYHIKNYDTPFNQFVIGIYFSTITTLNVGLGDIVPKNIEQIFLSSIAMAVGSSIVVGILHGALATEFVNEERKRENYRQEYNTIMETLRSGKASKNVCETIKQSLLISWKFRKGFKLNPQLTVLPESLQREVLFDVNFWLMYKGSLFGKQPKSFLRSVAMLMKFSSFLPGEIISSPMAMGDCMICVSSGVIEVLSEETNETTLFSLTNGSVVGEATLLLSQPVRITLRASTYVTVQILHKVSVCRLALRFPIVYKRMRDEVINRLKEIKTSKESDTEDEYRQKKSLIRFLSVKRRDLARENTFATSEGLHKISNMYVVSENIPRVKVQPIIMVRDRPWILRPESNFTSFWSFVMFITVSLAGFMLPYFAAFKREINPTLNIFLAIIEFMYVVDLLVQCCTAVEKKDHFTYTVSIKQIISIKLKTVGFYLDVISAFELNVYADFVIPSNPDFAYLLLSQNRLLRLWHIPEYFDRLENNIQLNILFIRTLKYFYYLNMLGVCAAAVLYLEACFEETCHEERWFAKREAEVHALQIYKSCSEYPTTMTLYFAFLLLPAVGYGDIYIRSIADCIAVLFCAIIGCVAVTLCTSQASATFRHICKERTDFQEEVFSVDRFMVEHEISKELQMRVRNYYRLQWNYDHGFSIKYANLAYQLPPHLAKHLLKEIKKRFTLVPLFEGSYSSFLMALATVSRTRILPPGEIIAEEGSFFREMYIIHNGYCEVTLNNDRYLIGPGGSLGYSEMMVGIPLNISIKTVTHVRIISLDYPSYLRIVSKHSAIKTDVDSFVEKDLGPDRVVKYPFLRAKLSETADNLHLKNLVCAGFINTYLYHKRQSSSYWEPFKKWGKFRFLGFLLIPGVISPESTVIKTWMTLRVLIVTTMGFLIPIYFSVAFNSDELYYVIMGFQISHYIEIYGMFHVCYYNDDGLLMFHPSKTALHYLTGPFILDVLVSVPFYFVRLLMKSVVYSHMYHIPGLLVILPFYKFFQACYYLENDVLRRTELIKIVKFIPLAIIITNGITGLLILVQCVDFRSDKQYTNTYPETLLRDMYGGLLLLCRHQPNATGNNEPSIERTRLYIITYYWVCQTMTGVGFGDVAAHNLKTMTFVIIIIIVGVFLYGWMFSSITSSMITTFTFIMKYRRRTKETLKFMKSQQVPIEMQNRVLLHYEYNWVRTEGAMPQKMLAYVHEALAESMIASMYETTMRQVPVFVDVEKSIIRAIGKHLHEIYFLRGEHLVRFDDIQIFIYLIYRGKVHVLSDKNEFITSMGSGGLFGNLSNTPFSLSSVNIVAVENVDVLRIECQKFFKALQVFPNAKPLIAFLTSQKRDYITPIGVVDPTSETTENKDTLPYDTVEVTTKTYPTEGKNLYLKNSLYSPDREKQKKKIFITPIILPGSYFSNILETSVFTAAILSVTLSLYGFCFNDGSLLVSCISYILDIIFLLKIYFTFHTAFRNSFGDYVINKNLIKMKYLKSKDFMFDVLGILPLEIFCPLAKYENDIITAMLLLRLNRTLRIFTVFTYFDMKSKTLMVNKIHLELVWLTVWIGLQLHFIACGWYFVACPFGKCVAPCWVTTRKLDKASLWKTYIYSCYYAVTIMTTTGYGDTPTFSTRELLASIVFMIISRFGIVILAGTVAAVINVHSLYLYTYQNRVSNIRENFENQHLSKFQMEKLWNYVSTLWTQEKGKHIPKFLTRAPYSMKCEIMYEMFGEHLAHCYAFSNLGKSFIRQLAANLRRFKYFKGNYIVQQGDIDNTMYFVHTGEVAVLTVHPNLMETNHFSLTANDNFGLRQGIIKGTPHEFSYRADTDVEMLSLTYDHWKHLLRYFPQNESIILTRINNVAKYQQ